MVKGDGIFGLLRHLAQERQKYLETSLEFKTEKVTVVNRAQRRALGLKKSFTGAGGRSAWHPNYLLHQAERALKERKNGEQD